MTMPTVITTKLDELNQLCEKYPSKIPVRECAAFLGLEERACVRAWSTVPVRSDWAGSRKTRTTAHSTFRH